MFILTSVTIITSCHIISNVHLIYCFVRLSDLWLDWLKDETDSVPDSSQESEEEKMKEKEFINALYEKSVLDYACEIFYILLYVVYLNLKY